MRNKQKESLNNSIKLIFNIIVFLGVLYLTGFLLYLIESQYNIQILNSDLTFTEYFIQIIYIIYLWAMKLFDIWYKIDLIKHNYFKMKIIIALFGPISIWILIQIVFFQKIWNYSFFHTNRKQFGDAHWATDQEIKTAGLREQTGVLLGRDKQGLYIAGGYQHVLLFAPTGSGKGVGFVIPNLLFWQESVIVSDMKLENYEITSNWRASQGQKVFVWEPSNPNGITHCYNPLDWISEKFGKMIDDVQKIGNLIITKKDFWNNEARTLFVGIVLMLLADNKKIKSFGEVVRAIRSDDFVTSLSRTLDTLGNKIHPVGFMNLSAFLQKAEKERSGVISTLNSGLELWANPLIDAATAYSDFNLKEIKKVKTTIYVGITPDNLDRLQKLMQVFYQQATEFLTTKIPDIKEEPYGVLFLMDEFPALGKMDQFKSGIAFFRGYRVRLFLIVQDTQQLKGIYKDDGMNSFLSNSTYRITFSANNYETANLISNLIGNETIENVSESGSAFWDIRSILNNTTSKSNISVSKAKRALLLPQEVMTLPKEDQIILIESFPPIKSKKIRYYTDKNFTSKIAKPIFVPTQKAFNIYEYNDLINTLLKN